MRKSWWVLLAALIVTLVGLERTTHLKVDTNLQALMPEGVPSVENLERVLDKTGSFSSAMVVITSPDPEAAVRFASAMQRRVLLELDWVASADYAEDFSLFERHKLLYLSQDDLETLQDWAEEQVEQRRDQIIQQLAGLPVNIKLRTQPGPKLARTQIEDIRQKIEDPDSPVLGRGSERVFQSDDKEVTLLVVWPKDSTMGLETSRKIISDLEHIAEEVGPENYHPDMTVDVGGRIYNRVVQFDAVISDVNRAGLISLSLIILLLIAYYRSVLSILYLVIPLGIGIIWTMGLTEVVIGGLNLITVFLFLILFGLGIDFGIHSLSRYREARLSGVPPEKALVIILSKTGAAALLAAITTAAGFFSLLITDFRAFYEFGFIAGTGIAFTYISTYTVLPALLALAENYGIYKPGFIFKNPFKHKIKKFPSPQRVLVGVGVLLSICFVFANMVQFENDFGKLQAERDEEHEELQNKISKVFPDGTDRAVLIVETLDEVKAITEHLREYIAQDTETPTIRKVDSIFSYVPEESEQQRKLEQIREIKESLGGTDISLEEEGLGEGTLNKYLNIGRVEPEDLPEGLQRVYRGLPETPGFLIYIFNAVSMYKADLAREFAEDIREITVNGKTYHPATEALIFVDMLELMKEEALIAILAVSGMTFIVMLVFFRNFKNALIVIAPTLAGLLLLFGIMGLFSIKLSIFNMVVLPTIIGIGVDNGIHIFHRFREERGSVMKVLFTTGWAVTATTVTTALGFSGMLAAQMNGLQSLGLLAVIGLGACLFTSWTLLPALLEMKKKVRDPDHIAFEAEK